MIIGVLVLGLHVAYDLLKALMKACDCPFLNRAKRHQDLIDMNDVVRLVGGV